MPIMRILSRTNRWPQSLILVIGLLVLAIIAYIDLLTGPAVSLGLFYFIPVVLFAWTFGRRAGYLMSITCAALWLAISFHEDTKTPILVVFWNAGMRLASYCVVAVLVDIAKRLRIRIEEMVADRTTALTAEIAERRRAEEAIHRLAAQLSEAEDSERRKLAQDVHDTLGQTLTVLKMNLQNLTAASPEHRDALHRSLALIEDMIHQTRTLTFEMYPAMLEHLGLVPTIRKHAEQFASRMQISISESGDAPAPAQLPLHTSAYLFRAVKELINNAAKHGNAREILISFHWRPSELRIVVDDDGTGFNPDAVSSPKGIGLASITERITSLGGKICIESSPGNGARVILEFPLLRLAPQPQVTA